MQNLTFTLEEIAYESLQMCQTLALMKFLSHPLGSMFLNKVFRVLLFFPWTKSNQLDVITILHQSDVLLMTDISEYYLVIDNRIFQIFFGQNREYVPTSFLHKSKLLLWTQYEKKMFVRLIVS